MQKRLSCLLKEKLKNREKIIDELKNISRRLKKEDKNVLSVYLFGSYSRGDFSFWSDADLIVVLKESNEGMLDRIERFLLKFVNAPVPVDVLVYTRREIKENRDNFFIKDGLKGIKLA